MFEMKPNSDSQGPKFAATAVGFLVGFVGFIAAHLPPDTPEWLRLIVGAFLAGTAAAGGKTHPGVVFRRKNRNGNGNRNGEK